MKIYIRSESRRRRYNSSTGRRHPVQQNYFLSNSQKFQDIKIRISYNTISYIKDASITERKRVRPRNTDGAGSNRDAMNFKSRDKKLGQKIMSINYKSDVNCK